MTTAVKTTGSEIGAPTIAPILAIKNGVGTNTSHIPIARRFTFSGLAYTQASNCGTSRIAVSVKSTIKMRSQAGRDHSSGDQIIVPNVGTRSSKRGLRMPTGEIALRAAKEGAYQF